MLSTRSTPNANLDVIEASLRERNAPQFPRTRVEKMEELTRRYESLELLLHQEDPDDVQSVLLTDEAFVRLAAYCLSWLWKRYQARRPHGKKA